MKIVLNCRKLQSVVLRHLPNNPSPITNKHTFTSCLFAMGNVVGSTTLKVLSVDVSCFQDIDSVYQFFEKTTELEKLAIESFPQPTESFVNSKPFQLQICSVLGKHCSKLKQLLIGIDNRLVISGTELLHLANLKHLERVTINDPDFAFIEVAQFIALSQSISVFEMGSSKANLESQLPDDVNVKSVPDPVYTPTKQRIALFFQSSRSGKRKHPRPCPNEDDEPVQPRYWVYYINSFSRRPNCSFVIRGQPENINRQKLPTIPGVSIFEQL